MATSAANFKVGDWVKVADWCGKIVDIAVSENVTMMKIVSFKGIFNHHPHEWLEYIDGMIVPATSEQVIMSNHVFTELAFRQIDDLGKLYAEFKESEVPNAS